MFLFVSTDLRNPGSSSSSWVIPICSSAQNSLKSTKGLVLFFPVVVSTEVPVVVLRLEGPFKDSFNLYVGDCRLRNLSA
ncbi:hypothetical protein OUZ56_029444 [Daphnia magna]|uniref:Uncharacterized protein n=1 Tax=Daphnia magna TaxID=35525 RepID=A0ABR0B6U7_9CRUS|nr:hypothetical protein OUZ56_029444 [Daphnia magna]